MLTLWNFSCNNNLLNDSDSKLEMDLIKTDMDMKLQSLKLFNKDDDFETKMKKLKNIVHYSKLELCLE